LPATSDFSKNYSISGHPAQPANLPLSSATTDAEHEWAPALAQTPWVPVHGSTQLARTRLESAAWHSGLSIDMPVSRSDTTIKDVLYEGQPSDLGLRY